MDPELITNLIESSDCMMYACFNVDATIQYITKSCHKILGYTQDELIGKSIFDYMHPGDTNNYMDFFHKYALNEKKIDINIFVFRLKCKDDNYITVKGFGKLIIDEQTSQIIQFNIIYVKTDNNKASFSDIKYLEDKVRQQTENIRLQCQLEMIELFISKISHEIRNPLNAVLGLNELLTDTRLSEEQTEYVGGIKESGNHLLDILNNMLDLSKMKAGKIEVNIKDISINNILIQLHLSVKYKIICKKIKFKLTKLPEEHQYVKGDRKLLYQLLLNLVGNSIKFTPEKGIIEVGASLIGKNDNRAKYQFIVHDSGIGMSKSELKKIFKPYVQSKKDISDLYGGTGLGLSIVKEIVNLLDGGDLIVESECGKGTTFILVCWFKKN